MNKIGEQIRYIRKIKKVTQEGLSRRSGVSAATIGAIEKGSNFSVSTLQRICSGLGVFPVLIEKERIDG